jgi:hypothetical protein
MVKVLLRTALQAVNAGVNQMETPLADSLAATTAR